MRDIFAEALEVVREFNEAKDQFGKVEYEKEGYMGSREIALTQQPYIDGKRDETPIYRALGIDRNGNHYEIIWEVKDNWQEVEDEQQMCEWNQPAEIIEY